jgi:hypothetical protein
MTMIYVPHIRQADEFGCGSAALSMVLQAYGQMISEAEILEGIGGIKPIDDAGNLGTIVADNAWFAAEQGYPVECYTYNLRIFQPSLGRQKPDALAAHIICNMPRDAVIDNVVSESYLKLLAAEGQLKITVPTMRIVNRFLRQEIPLIASVDRGIFYDSPGDLGTGHSIVVLENREGKVGYNDPGDGYEYSIDRNLFFAAMNFYAMNHSAYLIAVQPKEKEYVEKF